MQAFTGTLVVELTTNVWTDITPYLSFRSGPVTIRQGRPTEYDDVAAGMLTFQLWNDDGRFMPANPNSPYYPDWGKGKRVKWEVTHSGTTYTRFVGWVQAIAPDFPDSSTIGSVVTVTATDALGLLAQRKLRSNFTETLIWRARLDGCQVDAYEANGRTSGVIAYMTNYSDDSVQFRQAPGASYNYTDPILKFGTDNDTSIGGIVSIGDADTFCKTIANFQGTPLQIILHLRGPSQQVAPGGLANGIWQVGTYHNATNGGSAVCHLTLQQHGAATGLYLRNAGNTANITLIADIPFDQWARVKCVTNAGNAATSDWSVGYANNTEATVTGVAIDIRNLIAVEIPSSLPYTVSASWGGIAAIGTRTAVDLRESWRTSPSTRTLSTRIGHLSNAVGNLPAGAISTVGTVSGNVSTGAWSDRSALEVLHEMMRTHSGVAWARPRDGVIYAIGSDQLYPVTPVASIDTDADCAGPPRLVDGSEAAPTRIDVQWPGGVETVIDEAAEADWAIRPRSIDTVAQDASTARAAGQFVLDLANDGMRISQVTADLLGGETDLFAALLSESSTLSGLYPTQRIQLVVPESHFGTNIVDAYVQGWQEEWGPDVAAVTLDTTPEFFSYLAIEETWTGTNGAAWASADWATATGGGVSGSTIDIQSNRGRILNGAGGNIWRRNTFVVTDVEITGLIQVQGTAEAQIGWRCDSSVANGYLLIFSVSGGVRIQKIASGSVSNIYTAGQVGGPSIVANTDYRFRLRHRGGRLKVRAWAASGSEPGAWSLNTTNTLYTSAGYVVAGQWTLSQTALFDDLTVMTGV